MTHADKIKAAAIAKYGSWEAYKKIRYGTPKAKADLLKAQKAGGKATTHRPFKDSDMAKEAQVLSVKARNKRSGKQTL